MEIIRIPAERVPVLIGKNSKTKEDLETKAKVELNIRNDGEVEISGETADIFFAKDVVSAIGRGFEPKEAMKLLKEGYTYYLIHLKEMFSTDTAITRVKGRVIGEDGKAKEEIEKATESTLSIYGNTIGIIATYDTMEYAKEAVYKILDGAPHTAVFNYLAKIKKQLLSDKLRSR